LHQGLVILRPHDVGSGNSSFSSALRLMSQAVS